MGITMDEGTPLVLVVENDDRWRADYLEWLTEEGYRLIGAANGLEGLEFTRMYRPGLIVMNLDLPGLDGWETARILRRDPVLSSIKILALTSRFAKTRDRDGRSAGCDSALRSPVARGLLFSTVRRFLPLHPPESLARVKIGAVADAESPRAWWAAGRKRA
jgi:CheY-like chemotaxis protein